MSRIDCDNSFDVCIPKVRNIIDVIDSRYLGKAVFISGARLVRINAIGGKFSVQKIVKIRTRTGELVTETVEVFQQSIL